MLRARRRPDRGPAAEAAFAAGVISSIEVAQELLEVAVEIDGDAQYLAADAAIGALDHAHYPA